MHTDARCSTSSSSTAWRPRHRRARSDTGKVEAHIADAVLLCTGGYVERAFFLSTNAMNVQRHRGLARAQARRVLRQPVLHADPPDLHSAVRARSSRS
jgi:hypothetical protein